MFFYIKVDYDAKNASNPPYIKLSIYRFFKLKFVALIFFLILARIQLGFQPLVVHLFYFVFQKSSLNWFPC